MNTIDKLIEYGLNKSEALVYLDVISHPDSSAFAIFKRLKLPKTSIYNILENLQERRLIESWKKNNILHFSAGSPKRLLFEVKTKEELLQTLIPDLINLSSNHIESDSVKMYEGEEGLKIVMHDELEYCAKNNINSMLAAATDSFSSTIPKFLDKYIKEREKANIFVKKCLFRKWVWYLTNSRQTIFERQDFCQKILCYLEQLIYMVIVLIYFQLGMEKSILLL